MELDICSLGNAIVDVQFSIEDNFREHLNDRSIAFGSMTLIEKQDQEDLISLLKANSGEPLRACGGSATNSIFAATNFGSSCHFTCKVQDDESGNFYLKNLRSNDISHNDNALDKQTKLPTGQAVIMVSPDAERTMCTCLGVSNRLSISDLDILAITNSKYLFIEGYLATSPSALLACQEAIRCAKKSGTKVAISLSDPNIAKSFQKELLKLINIKCDLLFCNESESLAFSNKQNLSEACNYLQTISDSVLITLHEKGCLSWDGRTKNLIEGFKAKAIDSNGAGDMFAGAVLHSINYKQNLHEAAKFGCYAASKKVENFGPRLPKNDYKKIKENYF